MKGLLCLFVVASMLHFGVGSSPRQSYGVAFPTPDIAGLGMATDKTSAVEPVRRALRGVDADPAAATSQGGVSPQAESLSDASTGGDELPTKAPGTEPITCDAAWKETQEVVMGVLPGFLGAGAVALTLFLINEQFKVTDNLVEYFKERLGSYAVFAIPACFRMMLSLVDVGSDYLMGGQYLSRGFKLWGTLAILFPLVSNGLIFLYFRLSFTPLTFDQGEEVKSKVSKEEAVKRIMQGMDKEGRSKPPWWDFPLYLIEFKQLQTFVRDIRAGEESEAHVTITTMAGVQEAIPSLLLTTYSLALTAYSMTTSQLGLAAGSLFMSVVSAAEATETLEIHIIGGEQKPGFKLNRIVRTLDVGSHAMVWSLYGLVMRPSGAALASTSQYWLVLLISANFLFSLSLFHLVLGFKRNELPKQLLSACLSAFIVPAPCQLWATWTSRLHYQAVVALWRFCEAVFVAWLYVTSRRCFALQLNFVSAAALVAAVALLIVLVTVTIDQFGRRRGHPLLQNMDAKFTPAQWGCVLGRTDLLAEGAALTGSDDLVRLAARHNQVGCLISLAQQGLDLTQGLFEAASRNHIEALQYLTSLSLNLNSLKEARRSPLMCAVEAGCIQAIKQLLASGADLNCKGKGGMMSIHVAAINGHCEAIAELVAHGADVHAKTDNGDTSLHLAALGGHASAILDLVAHGADVHAKNNIGDTSLHLAAVGGHASAILDLVARGADVHAKDNNGDTSLHLAAVGGHPSAIGDLVARGADVHAKNNNGVTSLHAAAVGGHASAITELVAHGADVHAKTNNGMTSLHYAAVGGHALAIGDLVARGADVHAKNNDGDTSLHLAALGGHPSAITELVAHGADVHAKMNNGMTSLHYAAVGGHASAIGELVARGADVHAKADDGETSLHLAAQGGHTLAMEQLVAAGADLHAKGEADATALLCAAAGGHLEAVKRLVSLGADLTAKLNGDAGDLAGMTAEELAKAKDHTEVANFLAAATK